MGSCIICGASVDGHVCDTHKEDVVFEFRGTSAEELTPDRFYRGTVDGYAEFGVFVDIGDRVTGLLHRSELDQRLESLDWEAGDAVFVRVQNVRDNGNVDLGWSIRQSESEFRGTLIDDPEADHAVPADRKGSDEEDTTADEPREDPDGATGETSDEPARREVGQVPEEPADEDRPEAGETGSPTAETGAADQLHGVDVEVLEDRVGDTVRLEGEIADARQTSGPTVFELRDATGTVDCAAFEEAGVRAYPEVEAGEIVRLDGEVRRRRGELQVETEALVVLEGADREEVAGQLADAMNERARPEDVEPLAADGTVAAATDEIQAAATAIRRAVLEDRPVIVRHDATADGYAAGVALERATLPLVRDQHGRADAEYHYFNRRPLEDGVYDMADATNDTTDMLDNRARHDEKLPLVVFAATGATRASLDGFELLEVYDAGRVVVDAVAPDPEIEDAVDVLVAPSAGENAETTATALAANVAAHVNDDVRADLAHLPAVSFWEATPDAYAGAAESAGYDAETVREIREAIALEAYYQSYEDKRELIADLLFPEEGDGRGLASHVSEQFRTRMAAEVETAEANLERRTVGGVEFAVLDTESYTHRYEFPPTSLLLDELFRRHRDEVAVLVGLGTDDLYLRSAEHVDARTVADRAGERVGTASLRAHSPRDGRLEFLSGEREAVLEAVLATVADAV